MGASKLTKPKSIWLRPVKIELKPLFKALARVIANVATLRMEDISGDLLSAAESIGLETPLSEIGYILINVALVDAIVSLTRESASHFNAEAMSTNDIGANVDSLLGNLNLAIEKDFYTSPGTQPFMLKVRDAYAQWLVDAGIHLSSARAISNRLPSYFVFALSNEWRKHPDRYKRLTEPPDSPFAAAEDEARGWRTYFSFLSKRIHENIFDEPFSLSQVYIPLNAYYIERKVIEGASVRFQDKQDRICIRLDEEIRTWISKRNAADAIRVISGGPGSGKSSFTKVLCSELSEDGTAKCIYVPLHLIDPTRDISGEVERFVRDEGLIGFNPLDSTRAESNLLLVFDGLDELASMGKAAAQVARDFVKAVELMVERRNLGANPIFVLISGREIIIQENETEFRRPSQILNILPYFVHPNERATYVDNKNLLAEDLRNRWWARYAELTGEDFDRIPDPLRLPEIDEITAQPLLNYLVALSYRRGKLNFTGRINLNGVYADLLAAVHERAYEKRRTYSPISHLTLNEFTRVLEEIGLAAWHGSDGRSTSVRDIMEHCKQSGLEALLKSFTEGAQAGVTKLLAAFFFRRSGEAIGDDAAFFFTHKSFGEYLTAIRLTRALERIVTDRLRRKNSPDDGCDVFGSLVNWARIAGPAQMTEYVQTFLIREVAQRPELDVATWQEVLRELCSKAINAHIPMEQIGTLTFVSAFNHDANATTALLIALNACSRALRRACRLDLDSETVFGTFLRRVCPQRDGPKVPLIFNALSYLDLSGQCLDMVDLYGANLEFSLFKGASIHFGNFSKSSLTGADFTGSNLSWSRFEDLSAVGTVFKEAKMQYVKLDRTHLQDADFSNAMLIYTTFADTSLVDCSLRNAMLQGSSLVDAKLIENCDVQALVISRDDRALSRFLEKRTIDGSIHGKFRILEAP